MQFLHSEVAAGPHDKIEVSLNGQANVLLMDTPNFDKYRKGEAYRYYGGLAKLSPVRLAVPYRGNWHVVVNLGGFAGTVRAGVRVIQETHA